MLSQCPATFISAHAINRNSKSQRHMPVLHLGQAQASLVNASRFSDAPATDPTDPNLGPRDRGETPKPREEAEESEAEEENVQLSQVGSLTLDNFVSAG